MYEKDYWKVKRNKKLFEDILRQLKKDEYEETYKIALAQLALSVASYCPTGYFYSNTLEKFFIGLAQKYDIDNYNIPYKKGSCLHVMTRAFLYGGHTRVVERWIKMFNKTTEQSVVLLDQGKDHIPPQLQENVKIKNGKLIIFEKSDDIIEKALKLRKLSMEYEYVVLHTHMEDPIATIAFGTEKFKRPVILFNHADHMFWIGKTIADVVLDFRRSKSISASYRNIYDSKICTIPIIHKNDFLDKLDARKTLHLPDNSKILMLSGSSIKFNEVCNDNISDVLEKLFLKMPNLIIILLGVNKNQKEFQGLKKKYPNNLILKATVDFNVYKNFVSSVDLVMDSYPCSGCTTLIDALCANVPYVSLDVIIGQIDAITNSVGTCETKSELVEKTIKILKDNEYCKNVLQNEKENLSRYSDENTWCENLEQIINELPSKHSLRQIEDINAPCFINDYSTLLNSMYNINGSSYSKQKKMFFYRYLNVLGILKRISWRYNYIKTIKFLLFGKSIFCYKKELVKR